MAIYHEFESKIASLQEQLISIEEYMHSLKVDKVGCEECNMLANQIERKLDYIQEKIQDAFEL